MVGVYYITIQNNTVYKHLKTDNEVGDKLSRRLKKKHQVVNFKYLIETLYLDKSLGDHIVQGTCLNKKGDYKSPLIKGPRLSNFDQIKELPTNMLIAVVISSGILVKAITNYYRQKGYLIGDWTLHNIIFNIKTGYLVNIDLEGFYTYSPIGLNLSWNSGENNYVAIKKRLKTLQIRIIKLIVNTYKQKQNQIQNKEKLSTQIITLLDVPGMYQLSMPFAIMIQYPFMETYLKKISLGKNNNEKVYQVFLKLNTLSPSQLIIPINKNYNTSDYHYFYSFSLEVTNPIRILYLTTPVRSKII